MKKVFFCALAFSVLVAQTSYAEKWQTVGARAMAMGGAGVAAATGSAQQYYNPALLAVESKLHNSDISLNVNVELEATEKLLTAVNKIKDLTDQFNTIKNLNGAANAKQMSSIAETLSALQDLNLKNTGVVASVNAGLAAKIKKLAVSVRSYMGAGITPIVDTQNIGLNGTGTETKIVLGDKTSAPAGYESSAVKIANILDKYGLTASLGTLLGHGEYTSAELANAILNMVKGSSTDAEISAMVGTIESELPNAADVITAATTGGNYKNNETQVLVDAGAFTEVAIGYGYELHKGISVGGNLKFINGQMAETGIMVLEKNDKIGDTINDAFKERKSTNNFGIDLGVLFDASKFFEKDILFSPRAGFVVKNINNPSFDRPDKPVTADPRLQWNSGNYTLNRQYRAGAAINPLNWMTVAADVDVVKNDTMVSGFKSQDFSLGVELNLVNRRAFSMPIRAGLNKNIANSNSALEYTAGLGFCGTGFCLELAGGISSKTTKVDGNEIPASASVALNLGVLF